jgi:hypothetical protein
MVIRIIKLTGSFRIKHGTKILLKWSSNDVSLTEYTRGNCFRHFRDINYSLRLHTNYTDKL